MRIPRLTAALATAACLAAFAVPAAGQPGGDSRVTVGSPATGFSQNKQNEPQVAVNWVQPNLVVAGANDNIDLELCNAGAPNTCPFTPGVGVTGVSFSTNGGQTWTQPTYTGLTARHCVGPAECVPQIGPIGTLPRYVEGGLASNGDPAMVWGPAPDGNGGFSWARQRLYFANLVSHVPGTDTFPGPVAIGVSRLDSDRFAAAIAGDNNAWHAPVLISRQSETTFSDKEEIWADNVESSPFFGRAYVCNVAFRSNGSGAEPLMVATSTDGGDTWRQRQITPATNNVQTGGRQGCTLRTDSSGVVYVFWAGTELPSRDSVILMSRSFNGGANWERGRVVARTVDVGLFDPNQGRLTFDGIAGARTSTFPSADIANGAPFGTARGGPQPPNTVVVTFPRGPTPSDAAPGPNETAPVVFSTNQGASFSTLVANAAAAGDRPNFPAVAISPDGGDVYVVYNAHLVPWQSTTATARPTQGVLRHIQVSTRAVTDLHRAAVGDVRGSSANGLISGFFGDYNYVVATNDRAVAVWNDVRNAAVCPAINAYRQALANGQAAVAPAPNTDCPGTFGNTDIFGGSFADPS
ncbi:MAG TPA: hypothetical protein VGX25_24240 [Actinophytocola sp.]|uniref:hypothetical protein n=1 Tax=Actinophytocola sp. TaxID=1872138 RepID=UPI002DDCC1A9|nr:hypothetical protein [Actinophytocola sp.]HEV2782515.1 hypothetical protein [Actinophytocola sp.]